MIRSLATSRFMLRTRDTRIFRNLLDCVRLFTLEPLASAYWPDAERGVALARRRMNTLVEEGYLERQTLLVSPIPPIEKPLRVWRPGEPIPSMAECEALSYATVCRSAPPRSTTVYVATQRAANLFGGTTAKVVACQAIHDAHLAAVYLWYVTHRPEQARLWVGEDRFTMTKTGKKVPDAMLIQGDDVVRIIESAGLGRGYSARRIWSFFKACEHAQTEGELW